MTIGPPDWRRCHDPGPPHGAAQRDGFRYQQRFDAQSEAINAALQAADRAVQKAETATERRFEGVNEFRAQLSDQAATFITRVEYEALIERVHRLAARLDKTEGRTTGLNTGWSYLLGTAALIASLLAMFITLR